MQERSLLRFWFDVIIVGTLYTFCQIFFFLSSCTFVLSSVVAIFHFSFLLLPLLFLLIIFWSIFMYQMSSLVSDFAIFQFLNDEPCLVKQTNLVWI